MCANERKIQCRSSKLHPNKALRKIPDKNILSYFIDCGGLGENFPLM